MAGTPGFCKSAWETVLDGDKTFTVSGLFQIPMNLLYHTKGDSLKHTGAGTNRNIGAALPGPLKECPYASHAADHRYHQVV